MPNRTRHAVYELYYHVVFVPKDRPPGLTGKAAAHNDQLKGTSEFYCLVRLAPPVSFETRMRDGVVNGELATEHVITKGEFDYLRTHPERLDRWREYVSAGANVYLYDGDIPCNILVFDETVVFGKRGHPFVKSDPAALRTWAIRTIESYREDGVPLDSEAFKRNSPRTQEDCS